MNNSAEKRLQACYDAIRDRIPFTPEIALVLGSGLGDFADRIRQTAVIPYEEIEGFPVSTVPGHSGRFVFGYADQIPVVIMQGRVHFYEGYSMEDVVLPIRLMRRMGAEFLLLTNAAGGLDPSFRGGDLMMITDQISSFVPSPLIGPNPDSLGTRFPDMSRIYCPELQKILRESAELLGITLKEGVYVQMTGPAYESPAEVRMCRLLGGSAIGMSTACEAVAANHCGFRIAGISCITNPAAGIQKEALSHKEVQQAAAEAAEKFSRLLFESILRIGSGKSD